MLFRRRSTVISASQRTKECWTLFSTFKDGMEGNFKSMMSFIESIPDDNTLTACISDIMSANVTFNSIVNLVLDTNFNAFKLLKDPLKWLESLNTCLQTLRRIVLYNGISTELFDITSDSFE